MSTSLGADPYEATLRALRQRLDVAEHVEALSLMVVPLVTSHVTFPDGDECTDRLLLVFIEAQCLA